MWPHVRPTILGQATAGNRSLVAWEQSTPTSQNAGKAVVLHGKTRQETWKKYEFHIVSLMESRKPSTVDSPYLCEFMRMVLRMVGDGGHQPMSKIDQSPSDLRLTQWQRWLATIQCLVNGVGHWLHWMEHI